MNTPDPRSVIRECFLRNLGIPIENDTQDFFRELAIDSLAFLNIISELEKIFAIRFSNEELPTYNTCDRLARTIEVHRAGGKGL